MEEIQLIHIVLIIAIIAIWKLERYYTKSENRKNKWLR